MVAFESAMDGHNASTCTSLVSMGFGDAVVGIVDCSKPPKDVFRMNLKADCSQKIYVSDNQVEDDATRAQLEAVMTP